VITGDQEAALFEVLGEARDLGFLGPGPLERQVAHARGFAQAAGTANLPTEARVLDLGSGGGLPGLVLALERSTWRVTLFDSGKRRTAFLERAVARCGLAHRTSVIHGRAEEAGRDPLHRGAFDLVVARSFGPPAPTAECAAPFLVVGGVLVVSDRPDEDGDSGRWDEAGLARLGLGGAVQVRDDFGFVLLHQVAPCPPTYPRRDGVPTKRPLF
jgi:16S rRNA (guanine527-N7)-methyltransferase